MQVWGLTDPGCVRAQNQDTYDEESGLELHDVLEQAGDEGVDLDAMEEGEIATFEAVSAYSARSTQQVTIEFSSFQVLIPRTKCLKGQVFYIPAPSLN